jgi:hypothetical protein
LSYQHSAISVQLKNEWRDTPGSVLQLRRSLIADR